MELCFRNVPKGKFWEAFAVAKEEIVAEDLPNIAFEMDDALFEHLEDTASEVKYLPSGYLLIWKEKKANDEESTCEEKYKNAMFVVSKTVGLGKVMYIILYVSMKDKVYYANGSPMKKITLLYE